MDKNYLESLIKNFEKSLNETQRMSNSLIELSDILSKLDKTVSNVDKSINNVYEEANLELLTEKSIDAVSSLQLIKKQSKDVLKNINSFKTLQDSLCEVQKEVNEEYNNLIKLNAEKLVIKKELDEFKNYISNINLDINKLHEDNKALNKEIDSLKREIIINNKALKEEIIREIRNISIVKENKSEQMTLFDIQLNEDEIALDLNELSENKDEVIEVLEDELDIIEMLKSKETYIKDESNNHIIEEYFDKIGLKASPDIENFHNNLEYKYDQSIIKRLGKVMEERADGKMNNRLYAVKNESLDLSIDFSSYMADMYVGYFKWLVNEFKFKPKKILDLGCDNGIVTCFYALLYPDAKVVGVDRSKNSIKCAQELAEKLGISNIEFHVTDLKKCDKFFEHKSFDMITSTCAIYEAINLNTDERGWSLEEIASKSTNKDLTKLMSSLDKAITDDGIFITFERLTSPQCAMSFIKVLQESNFIVNKSNWARIKFHEVGNKQEMPLLTFSKSTDEVKTNLVDDIIDFYDNAVVINGENSKIEEVEIEKTFNSIKNKVFIKGIQTNYLDGSGKMREEIWRTEEKSIYYKYTNTGYRELQVEPLNKEYKFDDMIKENEEVMPMFGNKVYVYTSLEERSEIK